MKKKVVFMSDPSRLIDVRKEVRDFLFSSGFDESETELLVLALDEACTNIIRHAYRHECKPVRLEIMRQRDRVRFVLRDYGHPCDPTKIQSRALDDIRPGGLGVYIVRKAFDYVDYAPQPRGTKLTLEKKLPPVPREGRM